MECMSILPTIVNLSEADHATTAMLIECIKAVASATSVTRSHLISTKTYSIMKTTLVCLLLVAAVAYTAAADGYTTKYDNINVDEILHSQRLMNRYFECLMDRGTCSPEATALKEILPDALQTGCSKCNDHQREGARKVFKYLAANKKDMLEQLLQKYDPDGKFRRDYAKEAEELGIDIKKD